jgi:hypothetical protein
MDTVAPRVAEGLYLLRFAGDFIGADGQLHVPIDDD